MVISSKTFSVELSVVEFVIYWPVLTSKNFLYPNMGQEENKSISKADLREIWESCSDFITADLCSEMHEYI